MNLFYKYSHLQRFEQQNEKDGRNEKGQRRNGKGQRRKDKGQRTKDKGQRRKDKGERTKDKGEMEMGEGKRKKKKRLPARNTTAESLSSIISFLKNSQTISCRKQANLSLA